MSGRSECGACCACGQESESVRNLLCFDFEAPPGFQGWGCLQCGAPSRGAMAVVCDLCLEANAQPKFLMGGKYAADGIRVPFEGFEQRPFGHDMTKHPEVTDGGDA